MKINKLPALTVSHGSGCLCCPPKPKIFPEDGIIGVGFGSAMLTKDGCIIYSEPTNADEGDYFMTGAEAEALAAADPDHDWRIELMAPLYGKTYQRHDVNMWVLVEQNMGFA